MLEQMAKIVSYFQLGRVIKTLKKSVDTVVCFTDFCDV